MRVTVSWVVVLYILLAAWTCGPVTAGQDSADTGTVVAVRGEAYIDRGGKRIPVRVGESILLHDRIETARDSTVEILFPDEAILVLTSQTIIEVKEHRFTGAGGDLRSVFGLAKGLVRVLMEKLFSEGSLFQMETDNAIAGVVGTDFIVRYDPVRETTQIFVFEGIVRLRSIREAVREIRYLKAGEFAEVIGDRPPSAPRLIRKGVEEMLKRETSIEEQLLQGREAGQARNAAGKGKKRLSELLGTSVAGPLPVLRNAQVNIVGREPIFPGGVSAAGIRAGTGPTKGAATAGSGFPFSGSAVGRGGVPVSRGAGGLLGGASGSSGGEDVGGILGR